MDIMGRGPLMLNPAMDIMVMDMVMDMAMDMDMVTMDTMARDQLMLSRLWILWSWIWSWIWLWTWIWSPWILWQEICRARIWILWPWIWTWTWLWIWPWLWILWLSKFVVLF